MATYSSEVKPTAATRIFSTTKLKSIPVSRSPSKIKYIPTKTINRKSVPNTRKATLSSVMKQHGYAVFELIQEKKDVNVYHAKREKSENLYKIEEYVDRSQNAASLNYLWLRHENLLPYQDYFENSGRYYFVADISRPNALKYIKEKLQDDVVHREALARKWMGQLVKVLKYCHRAALYLTDFDWRNTVIEKGTDNLILNAFDGMTDTTNSGCLQLGPKWNQPPELLRAEGCLRLSVPKIESWVVGCAILELLIGRHLGKALEQSPQQDAITQAQAWINIRTNLALLPFWLEGSNVSEKSKEFVLWVLNENSHSRPSIEDISYHSWITEDTEMNEDPYDTNLLKITQIPIRKSQSYSITKHPDQSRRLSGLLYRNSRKNQSALKPLLKTRSIHPLYQATELGSEIPCADNDVLDKEVFPSHLCIIFAAVLMFIVLYAILGLFL